MKFPDEVMTIKRNVGVNFRFYLPKSGWITPYIFGQSSKPFQIEEGAIIPGLLQSDTVSLRASWRHLKGTTGLRKMSPLAIKIFDETLKNIPAARNMFNVAAFASHDQEGSTVATAYEHSRRLTSLLDSMIEGKKETELEECLIPESIGGFHTCLVKMGFSSETWEVFGRSFADVMVTNIVIRACPNGSRTWNLFIALLTDRLRAGYEQKIRNEKFGKTSIGSTLSVTSVHSDLSTKKRMTMRSRANTCSQVKPDKKKMLDFKSNYHTIRKLSRSIDIANLHI